MGKKTTTTESTPSTPAVANAPAPARAHDPLEAADVLDKAIRVMDAEIARLQAKVDAGQPITPGESQALGNFARVLAMRVDQQQKAAKEAMDGKTDEEVFAKADAIRESLETRQ